MKLSNIKFNILFRGLITSVLTNLSLDLILMSLFDIYDAFVVANLHLDLEI